MIQRFFIDKILPGYNEMIAAAKQRTRQKIPAFFAMKAREERYIFAIIRNAKIKPIDQAKFTFIWVEKNKKRDKDNIAAGKKFIFDSLVNAKILKSDGWASVICFEDHFKTVIGRDEKPGVHVIIEEIYPGDENKYKYERLLYD